MNHISLFSGIGGFDLASEWMGWNNIASCEINPFGRKVLNHYWPDALHHDDVHTFTKELLNEKIKDWNSNDVILTGGFPCQPYSVAGKRKGTEDDRHLWPEMLRVIQEVQPRWIVGENVRGLVNWNGGMVFDEVQINLEAQGYEVQTYILPAASVNAPHQRYRTWFVAYSNNKGRYSEFNDISKENGEISQWNEGAKFSDTVIRNASNSKRFRLEYGTKTRQIQGTSKNAESKRSKFTLSFETNGDGYKSKWENFPTKSAICGGDDGISGTLDGITFSKWRNESIKAYGNAIVPQVAYEIFKAINEFELLLNK